MAGTGIPDFSAERLAAWSGGAWSAPPDEACHGVVHDTRKDVAGSLFVALRGPNHDGHAFVADAFAKRARAALVDRTYAAAAAANPGEPLLVVPDTQAALVRLAAGHRAGLSGVVLGITGSLGKTTVKEMTADILSSAGSVTRSPESWNNSVGVPLSVLSMRTTDAYGVFEVGMNHPGELAPLCALLRPDWAVMTRVGPVHTEFFESEEAIADEKATLLRSLAPTGTAVLMRDEPWFELLARAAPGRICTAAFRGEADYRARFLEDGGIEVREPDGARARYPVPLPGEPARRNALRAVVVGREHGISPDRIAVALSCFRPPPMRGSETVRHGIRWVNDAYNANPVSMVSSLKTFEQSGGGRRWVVLGAMHELADPVAEHRALGRSVARGPWAGLVTVGPGAKPIADGAHEAGYPPGKTLCCRTVREAAFFLRDRLEPGDSVLLKGSRSEAIERVEALWDAERTGRETG